MVFSWLLQNRTRAQIQSYNINRNMFKNCWWIWLRIKICIITPENIPDLFLWDIKLLYLVWSHFYGALFFITCPMDIENQLYRSYCRDRSVSRSERFTKNVVKSKLWIITVRANMAGLEVASGTAGHYGIESGLIFLDSWYVSAHMIYSHVHNNLWKIPLLIVGDVRVRKVVINMSSVLNNGKVKIHMQGLMTPQPMLCSSLLKHSYFPSCVGQQSGVRDLTAIENEDVARHQYSEHLFVCFSSFKADHNKEWEITVWVRNLDKPQKSFKIISGTDLLLRGRTNQFPNQLVGVVEVKVGKKVVGGYVSM